MLQLLLNFNLFLSVGAIFSSDSLVVHLSKKNFDKLVLQSDSVWFVKFYAPWCGHCQDFAPEFDRAAKALKGVVRLGAVNGEEETQLANQYGVQSYPTVKIFLLNKRKPEEFRGERNAKTLVNAAMSAVQKKVNSQLSGKPDTGPRSNFKDVVKLTDNNFKDLVLNSNDMWMINFYAPWCQTCQRFEPVWADAAKELKGKVKFGAVDVTVNKLTADNYKIGKYPTIKYFPVGFKNEIFDYNLKRNKDELVEFAMKTFLSSKPARKIKQIINNDTFSRVCAEEQLCVISFLPHLLDCPSKCRRGYLKILRKNSEKFKERMWGWLWSEAAAQTQLEMALDIGGFGYPAMVVLNVNKMKYTVLRGAFSEEGIAEFLRDLSYGRGSVADLKNKIEVIATEAWDGTDIKIQKEDEESEELSDDIAVKNKEEIAEGLENKDKLKTNKDIHEKNSGNEEQRRSTSKIGSKVTKDNHEDTVKIKEKDGDVKKVCDTKERCEKTKLKAEVEENTCSIEKKECSDEEGKSKKSKKSSNHKKTEDKTTQKERESEGNNEKSKKTTCADKQEDVCTIDGGKCEQTMLGEGNRLETGNSKAQGKCGTSKKIIE